MPYETLVVERRGRVGWLVFNRPEALNAMNVQMSAELPAAWKELDEDDDVSVIVTTGRGRAFSSGVDVKEVADAGGMAGRVQRGQDASGDQAPSRGGMTGRMNGVWKPVICAVNGICAGAGFHWVVDSDFAVASGKAVFIDPHVSVGQVTAIEPIGLLGRMPFGSIMRMVLMGSYERINAEQSLRLGLVTEVIDPDRFEDRVQEIADTIARNSPSTMMASKRAVWNGLEVGLDDAIEFGHRILRDFWTHPDNAEGARAFAEKRAPDWAPPMRPRL
jgi:enoyl-CoA hydratase/carnithine racemase